MLIGLKRGMPIPQYRQSDTSRKVSSILPAEVVLKQSTEKVPMFSADWDIKKMDTTETACMNIAQKLVPLPLPDEDKSVRFDRYALCIMIALAGVLSAFIAVMGVTHLAANADLGLLSALFVLEGFGMLLYRVYSMERAANQQRYRERVERWTNLWKNLNYDTSTKDVFITGQHS